MRLMQYAAEKDGFHETSGVFSFFELPNELKSKQHLKIRFFMLI